ncbi:GntR family transcriptional regulator [Enterococcus sp. S86.2]|uniref:GntR family transcriptional regulator n=1 Tax=Enterococcus sp. S86.2 TaxID=3031299 RepID=UPI0026ED3CA9|nr:GntR family transcriptional regulator [Enterococcus sp. S86.2]
MYNGLPIYLQVADELRKNIQIEKWKEGEKIPTEMELCEIYHTSRITIRNAIEELVKENLLVKRRPKGTYVKSFTEEKADHFTHFRGFTEEMKEIGIDITTLQVNVLTSFADKKLSKYLDIPIGEKIIILKRLRGLDNKGFAYFITYFKFESFFPLDKKYYYASFYELLRTLDIRVTNNEEIIEAVLPTKEVAHILKISQNTPVLKRTRFTSDQRNLFKEYTECYYIGSEYKYYLSFK